MRLDDELRRYREGALAADEQVEQGVAPGVFEVTTAELEYLARGQDDLRAEDVAARVAVADDLAAARVRREVAADEARLRAHRIAGVKEAVLRGCAAEVVGDDARLDYGDAVYRVDFEDFIHAFEREDDAASPRHGSAVEAAARAARRDWDALAARYLHYVGDLLGSGGLDDRLGHVPPDAPGLVPRVVVELLRVVHHDAAGARDGAQLVVYRLRDFAVAGHHSSPLYFLTAAMSAFSTSIASPCTERSATRKIGASGSVLTAMTVSAPDMPAMCCTAPDMPKAR